MYTSMRFIIFVQTCFLSIEALYFELMGSEGFLILNPRAEQDSAYTESTPNDWNSDYQVQSEKNITHHHRKVLVANTSLVWLVKKG